MFYLSSWYAVVAAAERGIKQSEVLRRQTLLLMALEKKCLIIHSYFLCQLLKVWCKACLISVLADIYNHVSNLVF